jgi:hypothetical protein
MSSLVSPTSLVTPTRVTHTHTHRVSPILCKQKQ